MFTRTALVLVAASFFATPAFAQKEKKAELFDFPFWSAPKNPHARAFVPGLQAALQLTPEQTAKILAVMEETVNNPELRKLPSKGDPNATADQLATANAKRAEASEKLFKEIDTILTRDQKALIEKINDSYSKVVSEVSGEFEAKFVAAKGNAEDTAAARKEQGEAITAAMDKKLDGILSNEQRAAVKKAADEEAKRAADKKNKPKPNK
jgi:hypothetical protein